ncbi:ABC-2 type transport system permease protein [Lentzea xinjiangensis]|uniref:ABC-2 type transport system permease protein n=1 Tax=Lentzea xinjiangensis TaxID=402600 RepID=A0A1H9WQA4_9PSEU|nr:ABC-2 family transporter protein [Lentzea xinjiangensis]SES36100.1 ABC-2 type transport system permease protein [Lentzea xinjiangensis]
MTGLRTHPLPKYLSIARVSAQEAIAYRFSTIVGVVTIFIWVLILYFLWQAAYAGTSSMAGYTWDDMRTYVVLAFGINAMVGWRVGYVMMATVRTGNVVIEYVRPLNYCLTQISRACGYCLVEGLVSLVMCLLVGITFVDIELPSSTASAFLFALSLVLGLLTKALFVFLVSLLAFWTVSGLGLMWMQQAVIQVFSGTIVPLSLMPDWLRSITSVLPLRGIVSTPLTFYLGKAEPLDAIGLLGMQVAWVVVLFVLANAAWRRAFDVAEIQGG